MLGRSQSTFSPSVKETEGGFPFEAHSSASSDAEAKQAIEDALHEYEAKRDRSVECVWDEGWTSEMTS